MYDSSMKTETFPLAVSLDLLEEVRQAAKETGLSMADVMRQSAKLGLPKLRQELSVSRLRPMTDKDAREAYAPDPEWDALEKAMTARALHPRPQD